MQKQSLQLFGMLVLLAITTVINYVLYDALNITAISFIYLLLVVSAAYFCEFVVAFSTAILAFLAINYFFTAPRYTFEVAHVESLTSLICFLIVSIVITSLVKQLKLQTVQASIAEKHAQFARTLAENLALATDVNQLLKDTCTLLQAEFDKPFAVAQHTNVSLDTNPSYIITIQSKHIETPDSSLLKWVSDNGKPISPYTDYWSKSAQWLLPFNRLPSKDPILVVGNVNADDEIRVYTAIKSCVDQISQSYQRLVSVEKTKNAELTAQAEAIQSALLASISHDMRTPLTSILGAATTLQQADLSAEQSTQLTTLIASQARYLATTTENILSLIRLESTAAKEIPMDWQSPQELIGIVSALYKSRGELVNLKVSTSEPELLIKGNANLLTQALVNLIDNAKQASKNQTIEIDIIKTNDCVNISVNDYGNGFDENYSASQIKKFSSTNTKGFGLGLSIVKAIAQYHDAIFTIHNRVGGGASATLSFQAVDLGKINA
jgi:two-component system, OmpR family, sensor histidine kinase KdpD